MEDKKSPADIPSNYVTLLQLQERWIKEQQRKLKEKQEEKEPNPQALKLKDGQTNRRNFKRKYRRRNPDFKQRGYNDCPEENGVEVVEENENENQSESTVKETKSKSWGNKGKKKQQRKKKEEIKMMEDGEARAQREEETTVPPVKREGNVQAFRYEIRRDRRLEFRPVVISVVQKSDQTVKIKGEVESQQRKKKEEIKMMEDGEARAQREEETTVPPVKREGNVPAFRYEIRRDRRLEFRPVVISVVQKSDQTVKIKGEVESEGTWVKIKGKDVNVVGESEGPVEIERKLGNLCLQKEDGRLETQNRFVYRSNSQYRSYNRGYNRIVNSRNVEYRVYNSGVKPRNGQDRGSYGKFSRSAKGEVWVKKEEVAGNGEGAGDQS